MTIRTMLLVVLIALPGSAAAEATSETLEKLIEATPIYRVPTTPTMRDQQRAAGARVMLVEGRPGYVYRDFLHATVPISGVGVGAASRPIIHQPQENPDVHGCVTVSFQIRPDGKTDAFEIVKSEPKGLFDKPALRAVFATEYETAADAAAAADVRHERSIWFLVARPQRSEFSKVNEVVEESRNRRREEQRMACEGKAGEGKASEGKAS